MSAISAQPEEKVQTIWLRMDGNGVNQELGLLAYSDLVPVHRVSELAGWLIS